MKIHGKCGQFESWDRNGILEIKWENVSDIWQ